MCIRMCVLLAYPSTGSNESQSRASRQIHGFLAATSGALRGGNMGLPRQARVKLFCGSLYWFKIELFKYTLHNLSNVVCSGGNE